MSLTEAQRQQMLAQTNKMLADLAKLSQGVQVLKQAEDMGMQITSQTSTAQAQKFIEQKQVSQTVPQTTPQVAISPEQPTPTETAAKVGLAKSKYNIGGIDFMLPNDLINSSAFQSATDEQKAMIAYTWQGVADQGQDIQKLLQAFEVAAQQSDIYMRQQIRTFEDTLAMQMG
jgi:hypothetical protein